MWTNNGTVGVENSSCFVLEVCNTNVVCLQLCIPELLLYLVEIEMFKIKENKYLQGMFLC